MTFSIQTNDLDSLIETGFFLNICSSYSANDINAINVVCKTNTKSKLLSNSPKTGNGHRLMSSYQRLSSKVNLTFVTNSTNFDKQLNYADKSAKSVA